METFVVEMSREQFEQKRAEAAQQGYHFEGDKGSMFARGVELEYCYDAAEGVLEVEVKHVSFADNLAGYGEKHVAKLLSDMLTPTGPAVAVPAVAAALEKPTSTFKPEVK